MIIGSHVGFSKEQLLGSVKEALSYNANTFMFYTGAPQNTMRSKIDQNLTNEAHKLMQENNILLKNVICHAPYIINLANNLDNRKWEFSIEFLKQEIKRCEQLGISYIVIHPGSSLTIDKQEALKNIATALNKILQTPTSCMILLETMAGKGSECGTDIMQLKTIIDNVDKEIGVCLDTCHLFDSGVSIENFDQYLDLFAKEIGLDKIHCLHLNDSKNPLASHKDRHANIGFGYIGFTNLLKVITNPRLQNIPIILETPYVGNTIADKSRLYPPYKFEIEMLRQGQFDHELLEKIIAYYK